MVTLFKVERIISWLKLLRSSYTHIALT